MNNTQENPFPSSDSDRRAIWTMLVQRDIAAFLAQDWSLIEADFAEDRFAGCSGTSNPDHWRIAFPTLSAYREEWINQAGAFGSIHLQNETKTEFLYRAMLLRDIEIRGDRAAAHKKFDGRTLAAGGKELVLNWQTVYWFQSFSGEWKITGFLGYLPNPMPQSPAAAPSSYITKPLGTTQHKTAGPYSPVLQVSGKGFVTISGQGPIDEGARIIGETIQEQSSATLENCRLQLEAAGVRCEDVFKVVVYLADMADWEVFNEVYRRYFSEPYPTRTAVQAVLWHGIKVEVDMLAILR